MINRRKVLARAAAATAADARKHRVAIIGCGRMGQFFAEVYRRFPDTELTAIAE